MPAGINPANQIFLLNQSLEKIVKELHVSVTLHIFFNLQLKKLSKYINEFSVKSQVTAL